MSKDTARKAAQTRYIASPKGKAVRKAANERHYAKAEAKEVRRAYDQQYGPAYYAEHKEQKRLTALRWRQRNRGAARAAVRRYEHRKRISVGCYTETQWLARLVFYGWRCYLCGVDWFSLKSFDRTIDHVIPLSRGGTNWPANLRPACRSCNSHKHAKVAVA